MKAPASWAALGFGALLLTNCSPTPNNTSITTTGLNAADATPAATGDAAAASGLSDAEKSAIKGYLMNRLIPMQYYINGSPQGQCTIVFTVDAPTIKNVFLDGATGKVQIDVPVTALKPLDQGPQYLDRYYYPNGCYGTPRGGWTAGQTATSSYDLKIEKWSSGWRPSSEQAPLQPTG